MAIFAAGLILGAAVNPVSSGRSATPQTLPAIDVETAAPSALSRGTHLATVTRVFDGDTFEARVHVWPGLDVTTKVRLRGVDAPELKARCQDERAKAEAARDALTRMLAEGEVSVSRVSLDKYGGRVVAQAATRSKPDLGAALVEAGLARPYDGGRRDGWCP